MLLSERRHKTIRCGRICFLQKLIFLERFQRKRTKKRTIKMRILFLWPIINDQNFNIFKQYSIQVLVPVKSGKRNLGLKVIFFFHTRLCEAPEGHQGNSLAEKECALMPWETFLTSRLVLAAFLPSFSSFEEIWSNSCKTGKNVIEESWQNGIRGIFCHPFFNFTQMKKSFFGTLAIVVEELRSQRRKLFQNLSSARQKHKGRNLEGNYA